MDTDHTVSCNMQQKMYTVTLWNTLAKKVHKVIVCRPYWNCQIENLENNIQNIASL